MKYLTMLFLAAVTGVCNNLNAQSLLGFQLENNASQVYLSFKNESHLMIVPIKINDSGPLNFILDTGSESGMIFDKLIIGENNLVDARTIPVYAKDGIKITDIWVANNIDINFSGVKGHDQSMLVLQENFVDVENVIGIKAHGILGSEIFNRFVVEVNYPNRTIGLTKPESFTPPKRYKKTPIIIENSRPYIRMKVKQKGRKKVELKLLIDTGASSPLLLDPEANDKIKVPKKTLDHVVGRSIAGVMNGKIGRVKKVKIGKFKFKKVLASYPDDWGIAQNPDSLPDEDVRYGTVGSELLSKFNIIFNYREKCIYLKPNENFKEPFRFNTIGLNVMAFGKDLNNYFVNDIIKDSPADHAGLQVGDEVIALNNNPAFFYELSQITNILKSNKGNLLKLIIRRDGDLLQFNLKHKRLL